MQYDDDYDSHIFCDMILSVYICVFCFICVFFFWLFLSFVVLCIVLLIYLILFRLQKKVIKYNIYASAVTGTVQSFSIKDARFVIKYIGYYGRKTAYTTTAIGLFRVVFVRCNKYGKICRTMWCWIIIIIGLLLLDYF